MYRLLTTALLIIGTAPLAASVAHAQGADLAEALRSDPVYVAPDAEDADRSGLEDAIAAGNRIDLDVRVAVLSSGDGEALASALLEQLPGTTVVVFTASSYGLASDEISQGTLTTDGEVIDDRHIELLPESPTQPGAASDAAAEAAAFVQRAPHEALAQGAPAAEPGFEPAAGDADPWRPLRTELLRQIQSAIDQNRSRPVPIGRWLTEDLVMAASEVSDQVVRRAARLVGVPESTFRRHFQKASADVEAGLATRTHSWDNVRPLLEELVRRARDDENDHGDDLIERARVLLLDDVEREAQGRISTGAALMGVTAPTYKRWLKPRAEP